MTWREWFYIFSLTILWGFLISGTLVREEKVFTRKLLADVKKNWNYYLLGILMPQMFIILVALQMIFDFEEFKTMVRNHYKQI